MGVWGGGEVDESSQTTRKKKRQKINKTIHHKRDSFQTGWQPQTFGASIVFVLLLLFLFSSQRNLTVSLISDNTIRRNAVAIPQKLANYADDGENGDDFGFISCKRRLLLGLFRSLRSPKITFWLPGRKSTVIYRLKIISEYTGEHILLNSNKSIIWTNLLSLEELLPFLA